MSFSIQSFGIDNRKAVESFIRFPRRLYSSDPHWVEPLWQERRDHIAAKNPYFDHAKVHLWIAERDGEQVGRISAQIDRLASDVEGKQVGFFGFFESVDDDEVAKLLFATAEEWLKDRGAEIIRGPFNFSINQESGLLVEGFDTPPYMMMGHAQPSYGKLIEGQGYQKAKDLYAWLIDPTFEAPPVMSRSLETHSKDIRVRAFDKRNLNAELELLRDIFNDAWSENWGFVPFTQKEFNAIGREIMKLVNPEYFRIAEIDGESAAMIGMIPNLNQIIGDLNGRLLPTGLFKLLWRLRYQPPTSARILLAGVRKAHQNKGLGAILTSMTMSSVCEYASSQGIKEVEMSWTLEDNTRINKMIKYVGGRHYKTYRVYEKAL